LVFFDAVFSAGDSPMANLNKVMLIGRLTRDPETRTFANGGKVANIGFAVNNRKKNQQTGEWEDEPVFVDVKAFNREPGRKLADLCEQYLHKGDLAYIEGRLTLDQWTSQDGQKQSKLRVVMEDLQFLQPKGDGAAGGGGSRYQRSSTPTRAAAPASRAASDFEEPPPDMDAPPEPRGAEEEIPF
jgi:single-strand DNA-binding protein